MSYFCDLCMGLLPHQRLFLLLQIHSCLVVVVVVVRLEVVTVVGVVLPIVNYVEPMATMLVRVHISTRMPLINPVPILI